MISPHDARAEMADRYRRRFAAWAVLADPGTAEEQLALKAPNESDVLRDPSVVSAWITAWREVERESHPGVEVVWQSRRWPSMGTNDVPVRFRVTGAAAVAAYVGRSGHWRDARHRATTLVDLLASGEDVPRVVARVLPKAAALASADWDRLRSVVAWLLDHPDSGLYLRQLPVRGLDTKWLERHRSLVVPLVAAVTGSRALGLASRPVLVRLRVLDPTLGLGTVTDLTAPVDELAALPIAVRSVVVVENLETLLALPDLPGVVAVHGQGYVARMFDQLTWMAEAPVVYWGDLDTDGLNILSTVRARLPQTQSVLMDRRTLEQHLDLCVPDPKPRRSVPTHLTPDETDAFAALREHGDVRLEQERIGWARAMAALISEVMH